MNRELHPDVWHPSKGLLMLEFVTFLELVTQKVSSATFTGTLIFTIMWVTVEHFLHIHISQNKAKSKAKQKSLNRLPSIM